MSQGKHRAPRAKTTTGIKRVVAGLSLAAAAATTGILADNAMAAPQDTTWGAPDTTNDTTWGTPATTAGDDGGTTVTPQDTTWG